jgi:hypothetical protein
VRSIGLYSGILYSTDLYRPARIILYSTRLQCPAEYRPLVHCIVHFPEVHCTAVYTVHYRTHYIAKYKPAVHCTVKNCSTLQFTGLQYTAQYWPAEHSLVQACITLHNEEQQYTAKYRTTANCTVYFFSTPFNRPAVRCTVTAYSTLSSIGLKYTAFYRSAVQYRPAEHAVQVCNTLHNKGRQYTLQYGITAHCIVQA